MIQTITRLFCCLQNADVIITQRMFFIKGCTLPYWGENCAQKCVCTGRGADRCDTVKGCLCKSGWHGDKCDSDIDECAAEVEICTDPLKTCVNRLGSYSCACRLGYKLTEGNKCEGMFAVLFPTRNNEFANVINYYFSASSFICGYLHMYHSYYGLL